MKIELVKARARETSASLGGLGIFAGALVAALILCALLPFARPLFEVPSGGIGFTTVHSYPKGFDYFVVTAMVLGCFAGGAGGGLLIRRRGAVEAGSSVEPRLPTIISAVIFTAILMFALHFHPHQLMDMFHEGEHLTPGNVMENGGRPYTDIFFLHGMAADGLIETMVWDDTRTIWASRFVRALLDATTLALIVPLAFFVTRTRTGGWVALLLSLCGAAAGVLPIFPYFRLLPGVLSLLLLAVYVRRDQPWFLAGSMSAASLGLLWSLDIGLYATATVAVVSMVVLVTRPSHRRVAIIGGAIAIVLPFIVLLMTGAGIATFIRDSFVIIPASVDAIWSLPAPPVPGAEWLADLRVRGWEDPSIRYYVPLILYGGAAALALRDYAAGERKRALTLLVMILFSFLLFRSAAGRTGWGHTRFASMFVGMVATSVLLEPLWEWLRRGRRRVPAAVCLVVVAVAAWNYFELPLNYEYTTKYLSEWDQRFDPTDLVDYRPGGEERTRTYAENARDLADLRIFSEVHSSPRQSVLDLSGELALYYFIDRDPAIRTPNLPMLSNPSLSSAALERLRSDPPAFVVFRGTPELSSIDGIPHRERAPEIFQWAEERYPNRMKLGRFEVGLPDVVVVR